MQQINNWWKYSSVHNTWMHFKVDDLMRNPHSRAFTKKTILRKNSWHIHTTVQNGMKIKHMKFLKNTVELFYSDNTDFTIYGLFQHFKSTHGTRCSGFSLFTITTTYSSQLSFDVLISAHILIQFCSRNSHVWFHGLRHQLSLNGHI